MGRRILGALMLTLAGCSTGTRLASNGDPAPVGMRASTDGTYGYTEGNPIKVGGASHERGPSNERAYLAALRGPSGEVVSFERRGSCCMFKTKNGIMGEGGLLDIYDVTYDGQDKPATLYLDMYDYEAPQVPLGFTRAPVQGQSAAILSPSPLEPPRPIRAAPAATPGTSTRRN